MPFLSFRDYGFTYGNRADEAVHGCSFDLNNREILLLAGDSGSGKSTLIKSINGLIPEVVEGRMSGQRVLDDQPMEQLPMHEISSRVGSVFQNPRSQFFTLNTTEELAFAMENHGMQPAEMRSRVEEVKQALPLEKLLDREIASLSSGERQLIALASVLVLRPNLLLFDEPSANLDYANAMRLKDLLIRLRALGKTVLVADHRFFYLGGILDRVLLLKDGGVTVFESEAAFRASDYNTRSFDLFDQSIPCPDPIPIGEEVAALSHCAKNGVLEDVSLKLNMNEIAVLVGINGAGKSTMAKLLTGSLKPDQGSVSTDGIPFYVMQDADYQLFGTHVSAELDIGHAHPDEKRKEQVLRQLNLLQYRDTHPFDLSGGEKQRLQIAVAALSDAKLLIFDEPTSGLDIRSMDRVVDQLQALAQDHALLVISHDVEFIRKVGRRVIHLHNGRIASDFPLTAENLPRLHHIFQQMEVQHESQPEA